MDNRNKEISGHQVCTVNAAHSFDNPLRRLFHKPEQMFREWIHPGMTLMDLGSGLGYFSIGMAGLLQGKGVVYAVDIQQSMLIRLMQRAERYGLKDMIHPTLCQADDITIKEGIDFALAFWMLHETPNQKKTIEQVYAALNPGGRFLIAEPGFHVRKAEFNHLIETIHQTGFDMEGIPKISLSRAVLLRKS